MIPTAKLPLTLLASAAIIGTAALASPVAQGGQKFAMTLTPGAEVPGPGDPNASGTAIIYINPGQKRICWEITTAGIDTGYTIVGAHIHAGTATQATAPLIHLNAVLNGTHSGCTTTFTLSPTSAPLPRSLIEQIRKSPENYYLNIHWADTTAPITLPSYAAGGIRSQLVKGHL